MRKLATSKLTFVAAISTALTFLIFSPVAYAGAPGNGTGPTTPVKGWTNVSPSPEWVAKKNAYELRSGVGRNTPQRGEDSALLCVYSAD